MSSSGIELPQPSRDNLVDQLTTEPEPRLIAATVAAALIGAIVAVAVIVALLS